MPLYLYGVVDAERPPRITEAGVGENGGGLVELVRRDGVAALVSVLTGEDVPPSGRNIRAHTRVLAAAIDQGPLLPAPFGTVLADREAVAADLLERRCAALRASLNRVRDAVEVPVRGSYEEAPILVEIIREDAAAGPPGGHNARVRVRAGRRLAGQFARRRDRDAERIVVRLAPLACDVALRTPPRPLDIVNASFLVDRARLAEFRQAVAALDEELGDAVRLRHAGPMAPHSFVDPDLVRVPAAG